MKRDYYAREDVVRSYDSWRFGGPGGRWVNEREVRTVVSMLAHLPRDATILDIPVGTGRVAAALLQCGFKHVDGADTSQGMLAAARARCGEGLTVHRWDAFSLECAPNTFDAVVSMRLSFHYNDLQKMLAEFARVLRPGGVLVCDSLRWSPRSVAPRLQGLLGGQVFARSDRVMKEGLAQAGFRVDRREALFLLPSLAYRALPGAMLGPMEWVEAILPEGLRTKVVWRAVREVGL